MKNNFSLSVAKPCLERWEDFTPDSLGGFCSACNKHVIDFTRMSDDEIKDFFNKNPAQNCGRFRPGQLRVYSTATTSATHSNRPFFQAGVVGLLLLLGSKQGYSKSITEKTPTHFVQPEENIPDASADKDGKIIEGTVKDEDKQPLPGVNIYLKGTMTGTSTDANGNFQFPQELETGDVLVFNFIGFETKEYKVTKDASGIQIIMMTLSMQLMGEVSMNSPYTAKPTGIRGWWQQVKSLVK